MVLWSFRAKPSSVVLINVHFGRPFFYHGGGGGGGKGGKRGVRPTVFPSPTTASITRNHFCALTEIAIQNIPTLRVVASDIMWRKIATKARDRGWGAVVVALVFHSNFHFAKRSKPKEK
jgi:hypothetical protein